MASRPLTIRVSDDLVQRIDAITDNRNRWIVEVLTEALGVHDRAKPLTKEEKRDILRGAKTINDVLTEAILSEAVQRKEFLKTLSDQEFAKLVAGRVPKETTEASDLEADVLSLQSCLRKMPSMHDITNDVSLLKGRLKEVGKELRALRMKVKAAGPQENDEFAQEVFRSAADMVSDWIARGAWPGFGDGGGITPKAYEMIAREARKVVERYYRRSMVTEYRVGGVVK